MKGHIRKRWFIGLASALVAASSALAQPAAPAPSAEPPTTVNPIPMPAPTAAAADSAPAISTDSGSRPGFLRRFFNAYIDEFNPPDTSGDEAPKRRGLDAPLKSPPLPSGEWQGNPVIGVPPDTTKYPLMKALDGTCAGDWLDQHRIRVYGWLNASYNISSSDKSNMPSSYWIYANKLELDQAVLRVERQLDTVQTDHIDIGFRSTVLFGTDYRYMTAGGWGPADTELLKHNFLYGVDFTEQYVEAYVPGILKGMVVRVGRWIACPDIETQFAPDNYLGTHSLLFTFDTYTQTGIWFTFMLNDQWQVQAGLNAGDDMAPWYRGATPCATFGFRWVSKDNNDSVYFMFNQLSNAEFRQFMLNGQPAGHDNFNYPVITWQHKFSDCLLTKTEAYYMWERDVPLGGTVSIGNTKPFGGGGGEGTVLPGTSSAYGAVNYTMLQLSKKDFVTFRNEIWRDEEGMRTGFAGTYTSDTIGWTHNFTPSLQMRPEVGYYRNWDQPAFDLGTRQGMWLAGLDVTLRF